MIYVNNYVKELYKICVIKSVKGIFFEELIFEENVNIIVELILIEEFKV